MVQSLDDARRRAGAAPRSAGGRVPPHNLQAEQSLLGAMLLSRDAIASAVEACSADDFYKPAHAHIFDAVTALYSQGEPADPVTVADELNRAGLLEAVGGLATLISLQSDTPATANAGRYARIVEEHALLRRLIGVASEIAELGYSVPDDVEAVVDQAETMVFEVAERRTTDTLKPLNKLLEDSLDRLEALYERGEAVTGVPTGFVDLDERLSGLQKSALVIVGARPAMGKCVAWDTRVIDPETGALDTVEALYLRHAAPGSATGEVRRVLSLDGDHRLRDVAVGAWVDDGVKPVFRVRTRLGREVRTTATHPFLTPSGWRPLMDLAVGAPVAVPRQLRVAASGRMDPAELTILAYMLGDGTCVGTTPRMTTASPAILDDLRAAAAAVGVQVVPATSRPPQAAGRRPANDFRLSTPRGRSNPLTALLRTHGMLGCRAADKRVPDAIFRLATAQVAAFLSRLYATDGSAWWSEAGDGYGRIAYTSVSRQLVRDIQHLLLRFGINGRIRPRLVAHAGTRSPGWELELTSQADVERFCTEIGIFSKESACSRLPAEVVARQATGCTRDALPVETWQELAAGAASDVYWDEIVAITPDGQDRVYDLTVPGTHNFVADDILVHNTAFALGIAAHAAMEAQAPVLLFSLEMSHAEITQRLLVAEARVDANRIRNGRLVEADWPKISNAIGRLGEAPLFIDDNPNLTVMELRAKARRLKAKQGGLGLIIVDYLQLMSGRRNAENRQVEISEISRGLKILARELEVPVIALSQLSRNLEMRADKRPILADLRESGCMPASTRLLRADTGEEVTLGELVLSQEQPLVWSLDDRLRMTPQRLVKTFPSGIKPVFRLRLASGREVEASANHPFRTVEGWTRLDALTVGDHLAVPRRIPAPLAPPARVANRRVVEEGTRARLGRMAEVLEDGELADLAGSDVFWDEVVEITPLGSVPTFDATVEGTHNFVANGIIAHNSLEQDADVVMFLYRDEVYNPESPDRGTAEIIVAKHRNGPTGKATLAFLDHFTRFANMARV